MQPPVLERLRQRFKQARNAAFLPKGWSTGGADLEGFIARQRQALKGESDIAIVPWSIISEGNIRGTVQKKFPNEQDRAKEIIYALFTFFSDTERVVNQAIAAAIDKSAERSKNPSSPDLTEREQFDCEAIDELYRNCLIADQEELQREITFMLIETRGMNSQDLSKKIVAALEKKYKYKR